MTERKRERERERERKREKRRMRNYSNSFRIAVERGKSYKRNE